MVPSQEITPALEIPVAGSCPEPTRRTNSCVKCRVLVQPFFRGLGGTERKRVKESGTREAADLKQLCTGGLSLYRRLLDLPVVDQTPCRHR
ncbi:hypothetical protein NDU88_007811 [Pleurodeles waltl]|uniref:Uncharacterized protein n=1 Tax=Pleurodeles waltl TaxID=8319 RepID=A0AAV7NUP0_PLEWA|nr:hypothetical protein NDU88_007811 [Pleurodeles waltl]